MGLLRFLLALVLACTSALVMPVAPRAVATRSSAITMGNNAPDGPFTPIARGQGGAGREVLQQDPRQGDRHPLTDHLRVLRRLRRPEGDAWRPHQEGQDYGRRPGLPQLKAPGRGLSEGAS